MALPVPITRETCETRAAEGAVAVPARELERLESLVSYDVLAEHPPFLAPIVGLATALCEAPRGAIGFLVDDRFEIRASVGLDVPSLARGSCLSSRVVEHGTALVLPDVAAELGDDHPALREPLLARAYAGVPLIGRDGLAIGALVVSDEQRRAFSKAQVAGLRTLAESLMAMLELHRHDVWHGHTHGAPQDHRRLRRAVDHGELVAHYQPVIEIPTGRTVALEALMRWEHPELGLVPARDFVPALESSGLIVPAGQQIRQQAFDTLRLARADGGPGSGVRMSVNVSPLELRRATCAEEILAELSERDLPEASVIVEVTEAVAFVDADSAIDQLALLRRRGVAISLDDYGAGHSSLSRVLSLPLSMLKLDRSLTARLDRDTRVETAVRSTCAMAAELGLTVVAEGVEDEKHASALHALGCHLVQGWWPGRPESAERTLARLGTALALGASTGARGRHRARVDPATVQLSSPTVIVDSMVDGAYVLDRQRRIQAWNAAATGLSGYQPAEAIGRRCSDALLNHVDDHGALLCGARCPVLGTMRDGEVRNARVWMHHRAGHLVPVVVSAAPVRDAAGTIVGAVETFRDDTDYRSLSRHAASLEDLAERDPLTGIGNRRHLDRAVSRAVAAAGQGRSGAALVVLDLDHFKAVNDTHGHDVGDRVLARTARTLLAALRDGDVVARYGGDEFAVVSATPDRCAAKALGDRLVALVGQTRHEDLDAGTRVAASAGYAVLRAGETADSWFRRADQALLSAKRGGRSRLVCGDAPRHPASEPATLPVPAASDSRP